MCFDSSVLVEINSKQIQFHNEPGRKVTESCFNDLIAVVWEVDLAPTIDPSAEIPTCFTSTCRQVTRTVADAMQNSIRSLSRAWSVFPWRVQFCVFLEQHKGNMKSEICEEFTVDLWTKFLELSSNGSVKWWTLCIRNNKESTGVMMPFELRGTALKPIKESHWKMLVNVWPWIIKVQTTAWMTYNKLLCWRLIYYRRFEELCKSKKPCALILVQVPTNPTLSTPELAIIFPNATWYSISALDLLTLGKFDNREHFHYQRDHLHLSHFCKPNLMYLVCC